MEADTNAANLGNDRQLAKPVSRPAPPSCLACPVRGMALFRPFSNEEIRLIARLRTGFRVLPPKTQILDADVERNEIYTLFGGWGFSYKIVEDGQRQITDFLLSGDLIGLEGSAVMGSGISVEAITHVSICVFKKNELLEALGSHPTLGLALAWIMAREDSVLAEHMTNMGRRSAVDRVAHLILELYTRLARRGYVINGSCLFPLTQSQMADALGLSPEHVNRALRQLREEGFLTLRSRRLTIEKFDDLADRVSWSDGYMVSRPIL